MREQLGSSKFHGSYEIKNLKPNTNNLFLNHIEARRKRLSCLKR